MGKHCIIEGCNEPKYGGSRYCHRHYLDRKAAQRKVRKEAGLNYRTLYTKECQICGASYNVTAKHGSKYCHDCRSKIANFAPANVKGGSEYVYSKNEYKTSTLEHRCIATKVIGRKLTSSDIVHHIDGNTKNNSLENLLFLSNKKHIKLHKWLNEQLYIRGYKEKLTMKESWDKYCKFYTDKWIFNNKDECIILNEVADAEEKVKTSLGEYFVREKSSKKIKSTCALKNSNEHIKKEKVENPKRYCVFCGNELKNRHLHINWNEKVDIGTEKVDIENKKVDIDSLKLTLPIKSNVISLFKVLSNLEYFGRSEVVEVLNMSTSGASKLISKLLELQIIKPVLGHGKGKYCFNIVGVKYE